jgi:hypothetical protein
MTGVGAAIPGLSWVLLAADLDPTLDPFEAAQSFFFRRTLNSLSGRLNPQKLCYEGQKLQLRLTRMIEAIEGITGARPGGNLQVSFKGETLEATVVQLGRRVSLGLGADRDGDAGEYGPSAALGDVGDGRAEHAAGGQPAGGPAPPPELTDRTGLTV